MLPRTRWSLLGFGALVLVSLAPCVRSFEERAERPVDVFERLDGAWGGTFVGYDASGEELYRIRVKQTYRTVDANTQQVEIEDRMSDGTIVRGAGANTASIDEDGGLRLRCVVEKDNGERVEHLGRVVRGADADEQIVWYSVSDDRVETFRESVRLEGDREVYAIDGMGRYGDTMMLMHGRYYRK